MREQTMSSRPRWSFVVCDSLETVLADRAPRPFDTTIPLVGYRGQAVSFQLGYLPPAVASTAQLSDIRVSATTGAQGHFRFGSVELVPCTLLAWDDHDSDYLLDKPGLYPDPVRPLPDGVVTPLAASWRSVWVEFIVEWDAPISDGFIDLQVHAITGQDTDLLFETQVPLRVVPLALPELSIINTHWFHCDGLSRLYDVDVFSEEHWALIDAQMAAAAAIGINSLLTPCWTPPLDTAVGTNRLRTQLIGITDVGESDYRFDFDDLRRWLGLCTRHGFRGIEISHLFTQWGAMATPAIWIEREGELRQRFGWDVGATDPTYRRLLEQLIPALLAFLAENWSGREVIFHISDEPEADQLEAYRAARAVVADLLEGAVVADAMSDFALFAGGAVPLPIVATNAAQPFLEAQVEPLWLYYCVAQNRDVANRFIGMPAHRNRVLGTQLWLAGAEGFLHWGFNFYNTQFSTASVDPFTDTCAGGGFLAGDAFLVYPGPDGAPWQSTRSLVFRESMDDHRALDLLGQRGGREKARELADPSITLISYPRHANHYRRAWADIAQAVIETL